MTQKEREDLELALQRLSDRADELCAALRQANRLPAGFSSTALQKLAKLAVEVTASDDDELRDNLVAVYGLCGRPEIKQDELDFASLMVDKGVSDIRDAVVFAEERARAFGLIITGQELLLPKPIQVSAEEVRSELVDVKSRIASIEDEIATIKVTDNQVGLMNIGKVEIKIDLASAIAAVAKLIDVSSLARLFVGARNIASRAVDSLVSAGGRLSLALIDGFRKINSQAQSAFLTTQKMLLIAEDAGAIEREGRIWTETEVRDLLIKRLPIPAEAAPYVRNLSFGFSDRISMIDLSKLTHLRSLTMPMPDDPFMKSIGSLNKLESLHVTQVSPKADLSTLFQIPSLRTLHVSGQYYGQNQVKLPSLLNLPLLSELTLERLRLDELPDFSKLSSLVTLSLEGCRVELAKNLGTAKSVKYLDIRKTDITNLRPLAFLSGLETLDMRDIDYFSETEALKGLSNLKRVSVARRASTWSLLNRITPKAEVRGDFGGIIRAKR